MPRHEECRKTNPCFPKDYEDIVGHIMTEANFFTPSHPRSVRAGGASARKSVIDLRVTAVLLLKPPHSLRHFPDFGCGGPA
jgi:hypothetical protein